MKMKVQSKKIATVVAKDEKGNVFQKSVEIYKYQSDSDWIVSFGWPVEYYFSSLTEADDKISFFVRMSESKDLIVSTDKDFFQLVDSNTAILRQDVVLTLRNFCEKLGYKSPARFFESRLLVGDSSDSIPGVPGVGRALRARPGKDHALILDFFDETHKVLHRQSLQRRKCYKQEGYEVHEKYVAA